MDKSAINICVQMCVCVDISFQLLEGKYQGVKLLEPLVRVCLVL